MPRSVMEHSFSQVPHADIHRSTFNRSHGLKTTFDADWLVPIYLDDIIPGDTFNVNCTHYARLGSPLLHPLMDNLYLETFFFFVPYRLLWSNWEKFMGSQDDPIDSIDFTIPKISSSTTANLTNVNDTNALYLYLGLPYKTSVDLTDFSAMPLRAYNLIWNDWFRDQNIQSKVNVSLDDGPDAGSSDYDLLKRGKRHDYFTSCLPWPQKGDAVTLPLGTRAPINADNVAKVGPHLGLIVDTLPGTIVNMDITGGLLSYNVGDVTATEMYADLAGATSATINDLRLAFQTQRLFERDARSGTRYVEHILAHFGVTVPDFRLQRPEFLGGGSNPIQAHEVPNTSSTATEDQAELAAYGTTAGTHGFTKSFVEHGCIIGLANVRSDLTYSQGSERYWFKETRFDFYYPVLAQIGEQAVLNRELFYQNTAADDTVFGYQERYAEYRYKPSRLSGLFFVDHTSTLASWHLSEDFASLPLLNPAFVESNTGAPLDRAITVPTEPHIIADFYFDMKCARPMPLYGVPGNLDHF